MFRRWRAGSTPAQPRAQLPGALRASSSFGDADLGASELALQAAFGCGRKLLHHAHFAHRHEIARRRVGVRSCDRQVVDTDHELRVGQASGADGQRLHGVEVRAANADLWRNFESPLNSGFERQRLVGAHIQRLSRRATTATIDARASECSSISFVVYLAERNRRTPVGEERGLQAQAPGLQVGQRGVRGRWSNCQSERSAADFAGP